MEDYKPIENITIQNVKGFGSPAKSLDVLIKPNKVNILYAPNGFGKSSIAAAFNSLKPHSLVVPRELKYHKDEAVDSSLSITYDGKVLVADKEKNEIQREFSTFVITCRLNAVSVLHNMGRFTTATGYLDISDIVVKNSIPQRPAAFYKIGKMRSLFGINGKVLPNFQSIITGRAFLNHLPEVKGLLDAFISAKRRMGLLTTVVSVINEAKGTAETIISKLDSGVYERLFADDIYLKIESNFKEITSDMSDFERFSFFYELLYFWKNNKTDLKRAYERSEYDLFLENYNQNLKILDSTWKGIRAVELDGKLVVKYPRADEISNGQRDVLTLVSQLIACSSKISENKKYIIIIDEVFDYLDDANTVAAQYFLSSFLQKHKGNVYLCLLTHLNPYTFRNYILNKKSINDVYLNTNIPQSTNAMKAFIAFRQKLDRKGDPEQSLLYDNISRDLFHYNPIKVDYSFEISKYARIKKDLRASWGKTEKLHQFLAEEVQKYLSAQTSYDPYAVAFAMRLRVEKILYEKLPETLRSGFIAEKMTKNKFSYCEKMEFQFLTLIIL